MEIVLDKITLKKDDVDCLKTISCVIPSGKIVGVMGNNGSGKSLLLSIIASKIQPTIGKVKYLNTKKEIYSKPVINKIGYLPQDAIFNFEKITVSEYLKKVIVERKYVSEDENKRVNDVLKMVNLSNYNRKQIIDLSHSEQKRLAIAGILIFNPKVIVLDEPFQYLDQNEEKNIVQLLRLLKHRYQKTIVIASIKPDLLHKLSDEIIVMNKGKIIKQADKYTVFEQSDLRKKGVSIPKVINFADTVFDKKNIKIGYRDEINDLIKDIYRYVR